MHEPDGLAIRQPIGKFGTILSKTELLLNRCDVFEPSDQLYPLASDGLAFRQPIGKFGQLQKDKAAYRYDVFEPSDQMLIVEPSDQMHH